VPQDAQQNPVLARCMWKRWRNNLMVLSGFGLADSVPQSAFGDTPAARQNLASQALRSLQLGQQKLAQCNLGLN